MVAITLAARQVLRLPRWIQIRSVSTLENNPYIVSPALCFSTIILPDFYHADCFARSQYVFPNEKSPNKNHLLSLLPSEPPKPDLAIGVTTRLPPTPESFTENPTFLKTLQEVLSKHAHEDPDAISQAQVMVSTSGSNMVFGGVLTGSRRGRKRQPGSDFSSGASGQGGAGSAGRGGWIHISDSRRPPEYGRIAW